MVVNMVLQKKLYEPLPTSDPICIIEIHPGTKDDDRIACTILSTSFNDAPIYEAISYTRGKVSDPSIVLVNKRSPSGSQKCKYMQHSLSVTQNCESMLWRLRYHSEKRKVWVDAICINQRDPVERSAQIAIMAQVYHRASQVVINLGEASEDCDDALKTLQIVFSKVSYPIDLGLKIRYIVSGLYARP